MLHRAPHNACKTRSGVNGLQPRRVGAGVHRSIRRKHGAHNGVSSRRTAEGSNAIWSCDARILRMRNRRNAKRVTLNQQHPTPWTGLLPRKA